jgi:hypothetical protein
MRQCKDCEYDGRCAVDTMNNDLKKCFSPNEKAKKNCIHSKLSRVRAYDLRYTCDCCHEFFDAKEV